MGGYSGDSHYILFGVPDHDMDQKYQSMVLDERYRYHTDIYSSGNHI